MTTRLSQHGADGAEETLTRAHLAAGSGSHVLPHVVWFESSDEPPRSISFGEERWTPGFLLWLGCTEGTCMMTEHIFSSGKSFSQC